MPVSALVITLSREPKARQAALDWLSADARITLGEPQRDQLPVVLETATLRGGVDAVRRELPAVTGVAFVHVISVDFSDLEAKPCGSEMPSPRQQTRS